MHADPRNREADASASLRGLEQGHGFRDYFMPETGIDFETLKTYVSRDGGLASARPTTFNVWSHSSRTSSITLTSRRDNQDISYTLNRSPLWLVIASLGLSLQY